MELQKKRDKETRVWKRWVEYTKLIEFDHAKVSNLKTEQNLWERSPQPCKEDNFLTWTKKIWWQEQCKRPWQNWVRSLGQMWGTTPHMVWDLMDSTPAFCDISRE
jgi:hypothetical protein